MSVAMVETLMREQVLMQHGMGKDLALPIKNWNP
jgi:hypothetical protein